MKKTERMAELLAQIRSGQPLVAESFKMFNGEIHHKKLFVGTDGHYYLQWTGSEPLRINGAELRYELRAYVSREYRVK